MTNAPVDRKEEAAFEIKATSPASSAASETPLTRKMIQDLTNEAKALEAEIEALQSEVRDLEAAPGRKVEARDMDYALKTLYVGHPTHEATPPCRSTPSHFTAPPPPRMR